MCSLQIRRRLIFQPLKTRPWRLRRNNDPSCSSPCPQLHLPYTAHAFLTALITYYGSVIGPMPKANVLFLGLRHIREYNIRKAKMQSQDHKLTARARAEPTEFCITCFVLSLQLRTSMRTDCPLRISLFGRLVRVRLTVPTRRKTVRGHF